MQSVNSWKYYNHAVIPDMAPHEEPVLQSVYDNSIWKQFAKEKPLFAMWTEGFDCGFETNWWYVIKDTPIDINEFTAKRRKNIRTALKKCKIYKIDPSQHAEELYETYRKALTRFKKNDSVTPKKAFIEGLKHTKSSVDYWWRRCCNWKNHWMDVVHCASRLCRDIICKIRSRIFKVAS